MSPPDRLASILWDSQLLATVNFSMGYPAVCLIEARLPGLNFMIGQRGYQPWGLMFDRQSVYDAGGGPAWHARPEAYQALDPSLRSWAVRLDPGSDWLEEREWRIVRSPSPPRTVVALSELRLLALLVGDQAWTGARWANGVTTTGPQWNYFFPPTAAGLMRFWWNPANAQLQPLSPLYST
jgi:hypothetical protein